MMWLFDDKETECCLLRGLSPEPGLIVFVLLVSFDCGGGGPGGYIKTKSYYESSTSFMWVYFNMSFS